MRLSINPNDEAYQGPSFPYYKVTFSVDGVYVKLGRTADEESGIVWEHRRGNDGKIIVKNNRVVEFPRFGNVVIYYKHVVRLDNTINDLKDFK